MCSIDEGFRFCTCDEFLSNFEVIWVLQRVNRASPMGSVRGRVVVPSFSPAEKTTKSYILSELNRRNCFDFDYSPLEDDLLSVRIKKGVEDDPERFGIRVEFDFRFLDGRWEEDTSTNLARWKTRLEEYGRGTTR